MSITSEAEWDGLREVGRVVRLTLDAMERHVKPGITTMQLDEVAASVFREHGARSAPALVYGFPGTVLISVNDEIVHGIPGARVLHDGDVVKLDVTAEKDGYMADAARTVLIGDVSEAAGRLRACAEMAFAKALDVACAGQLVSEIGRAVESTVRRCGFAVIPELGGHGIGRTIHEAPPVPNHYDPRQKDRLEEGMVLTIEPIISSGSGRAVQSSDGWTIRTRDGSLAAHHEHTLVITRGWPLLLTAA